MPLLRPGIYLMHAVNDRRRVRKLRDDLTARGFRLVDLPVGEDRGRAIESALAESEVVLVCLSEALFIEGLGGFVPQVLESDKSIIPIYLEDIDASLHMPHTKRSLYDQTSVDLAEPDGFEKLVDGLERLFRAASNAERFLPDEVLIATPRSANYQVRRIALENIRCFETLELTLPKDGEPALFTMILGNNAAGKSTLLRSIALGLSSEAEASALIKQLPGSFVRRGAETGTIRLDLCADSGEELSITTRISKNGSTDERIRKETEPDPFPWQDLFVCAYGTNRARQAAASYETYTLHQAVLSLFDDDAALQNPEVVLLRQGPLLRSELERRLLRILMLDDASYEVTYPKTGPEIQGPWGDQPLRVLSDGYRSTAQWVLDFLGWSIYAGRFTSAGDIGGILLVDEIEQHLHPLWQRHVVQRLHQLFPKTQIFASTHTPLAASGVADVEGSCLLRLKTEEDGSITSVEIDPQSLAGMRADQVLASEAFGLHTTRNPGSEDDVSRYAELLGKESRTDDEEAEMQRLATALESSLRTGESQAEREVEQAVEAALKARVTSVKPELLDLEARRQLHELFAGDKDG